ncbi:MAG: flagellar hook-associated protein FlgK [Hydrogenophilales bacterium CG03_land_8_20_14_0_80_62_28]|nr:MAG: flagellar hook-associated protein FlgK [Hydrogenophilaceae bacterium CG1_02_62_390]PIV22028.1 MAG: flagellar hook-associated protein FlgK [Hydrogenophilales bacterium CG03_land_8_20_14_0_80_62_28]PIW72732.1 MAG: flagellar hook-associated protein FlgK [Hydrogenophilales bacterium CG12_big_fil_rev_8_21_14_0_65_61_21]PIX01135.1 MAG: flagellar hook-associated protein FlgK [Hydrogenophilales bacterium CG_4_8_14_3_um_filter_62_83]PIY98839.1 MAG: flagellar hook-associated protein FlgK [Hydroge
MASGIFGITLMGLNAAQSNLSTTSQNIANVNTAGYHRQSTNLTTAQPMTTGYGMVGSGVDVVGVARSYSRFLENQVVSSQGQLSSYQTYGQYASQLNALLGNQNSALSASLADFFASVQNVANDPTSIVARQALIASGNGLTGQFDNASKGLSDLQQSVDQQVQSIATQVSSYGKSIAVLNTQITVAQASGSDKVNALLDQRDQLVAEINKLVNVNVLNQTDSGYTLYIGNGLPLVQGSQANVLKAVANPADPTQSQPALQIGNGIIPLDTAQITGGQLGGLLAFRDQMLMPSQRELGKVAYTLATRVNGQSGLGFDLNGAAGTDFFSTPAVRPPVANLNNTGNGLLNLSLTDPNLLANSDYKLAYDGANYTLTRVSDGTSYSNATLAGLGAAVSAAEGFSFSLSSGTINAGDSYLIRPSQYAANGLSVLITDPSKIAAAGPSGLPGDNGNALLLASLQSQKLLANGSVTLQTAFNQLVGQNASLTNAATLGQQSYQTLTDQATQAQQSFSGVNLDEEAANLIQYQQAYQAAAKAMQIASSLFNNILSAIQ